MESRMIEQKSPALSARQYLDAPTEFKFKGDTGAFEGYASVFGNVDQGGDRILPGAFKEIKTTRDGKVLVLLQHRTSDPIGKADFEQDSRGLLVHGDLMLDDPVALSAYRRMKTGLLDCMSIGYDILPGGAKVLETGVRELSKLQLWEVSVVTFGMNQLARVDVVKSAAECKTIREFQDLVRDALGLSVRQAGRVATAAWPAIADREDLDADGAQDQKALLASYGNLIQTIERAAGQFARNDEY
jgi:HK97 family phage prohead protease